MKRTLLGGLLALLPTACAGPAKVAQPPGDDAPIGHEAARGVAHVEPVCVAASASALQLSADGSILVVDARAVAGVARPQRLVLRVADGAPAESEPAEPLVERPFGLVLDVDRYADEGPRLVLRAGDGDGPVVGEAELPWPSHPAVSAEGRIVGEPLAGDRCAMGVMETRLWADPARTVAFVELDYSVSDLCDSVDGTVCALATVPIALPQK